MKVGMMFTYATVKSAIAAKSKHLCKISINTQFNEFRYLRYLRVEIRSNTKFAARLWTKTFLYIHRFS